MPELREKIPLSHVNNDLRLPRVLADVLERNEVKVVEADTILTDMVGSVGRTRTAVGLDEAREILSNHLTQTSAGNRTVGGVDFDRAGPLDGFISRPLKREIGKRQVTLVRYSERYEPKYGR